MTEAHAMVARAAPTDEETAPGGLPVAPSPCPHFDASALRWPERPELEPFMRATYEAHVALACLRGNWFRPEVPAADLGQVEHGHRLRTAAAADARRMLAAARRALQEAKASGDSGALSVHSFGVSSSYRSGRHQLNLWASRFPRFYRETEAERAALPGGPLGPEAARWLARRIGVWLGAPGFSNHNDGRALDLHCRLAGGRTLGARRTDIPGWHASWLHAWLASHAAAYGFHPYRAEPWHWDHRGPSAPQARSPEQTAVESTVLDPAAVDALEAAFLEGESSTAASDPVRYWQGRLRFGLAGNTVEPLIDGRRAFAAMQRAIESATGRSHYVYLLGWWVDPWVNLTGAGSSLLDLFERAGRRGVQVRVLMWDPSAVVYPNHARLHAAAVAAINKLPNCHAQEDAGGGLLSAKSHHQKLLVVNGTGGLVALCGGVDVNVDRVHDVPPPPGAVRRDRPSGIGWVGASGGSGSSPGTGNPLHDVHVRVTGPTALPLLRMFLRRWWARSGSRDIDRTAPLRARFNQPPPPRTGRQYARVGETFDGVLRSGSRAVRSRQVAVQDIWLRSILGARRFVYMEEQYLTLLCAAEAIRTVLPRLEHVTILIPPSEITDLPGVWRRRRLFIEHITRANRYASKLHVYTRKVGTGDSCRRSSGAHLYVHSKMAVIDDELMLVGSANCNHRGWETDSELVVASFEAPRAGQPVEARRLRMQLWAHHLGVPESALADPVRSRRLWDTAPTRRVCAYDPRGGRDGLLSDRPDAFVDPSDRRPTDPCCSLLRLCP